MQIDDQSKEADDTINQVYQNILIEEYETDVKKKPKIKYSVTSNSVLQSMIGNATTIKGYLLKKSPRFLVGWQNRFCEAKGGKLFYFMKDGDVNFKGCIDFSLTTVILEEEKNGFNIIIQGTQRKFYFKCHNQDSNIDQWIHVIRNNIKYSLNLKTGIIFDESELTLQNKFWKNDRISLSYFEREADTGDILLFKGKNTGSSIQRFITKDQYDHVALILRYNTGQLYLFESLGKSGVALLSWDKFLMNDWHTQQEKLVYRKLFIERTTSLVEQLELFIKQNIGKQYNITAKKIICRWKKADKEGKPSDTFFCSELIAEAYKKMGLLPKNISSASYWPGQFSSQNKLQMLSGSLGNEMLLDFQIYQKPKQ